MDVDLRLTHEPAERAAARTDGAGDDRRRRAPGEECGGQRERRRRPTRRCGLVAVALAAALAGCARPSPPASDPPGPLVDTRAATLANGFITVRVEIPSDPSGPKPVVIGPVFDHDALLAAGAIVVTYGLNWHLLAPFTPPQPAPEPSQRSVGKWLLAAPTPKTVGQGYFALIEYNAEHAVSTVVDHLVTLPEVDPARIGIAGSSTGGFVALQAVAAEPRLAVAAVTVACGDYRAFLHHSSLAMAGAPLDLDPAYDRSLAAHEPAGHPARLVHTALLMVNGRDDQVVPLECVRPTVRAFRHATARAGVPERFRFVLVDAGHALGDTARTETMAWWYRWLLPPGAPPVTSAARRRSRSPSR